MGEYEPDDSRNVSLKPGNVPGEPERTGPRENQTRLKDEERRRQQASAHEGDHMFEPERHLEHEYAIENPTGDPRPEYDQYAVNDPSEYHAAITEREEEQLDATARSEGPGMSDAPRQPQKQAQAQSQSQSQSQSQAQSRSQSGAERD